MTPKQDTNPKTFTLKCPPGEQDALYYLLTTDHAMKVVQAGRGYDITGQGVYAHTTYDAQKQELTVYVFKHPFYLPIDAIKAGLETLIAGGSFIDSDAKTKDPVED